MRTSVAPRPLALRLIERLRTAGFAVTVDPGLAADLDAAQAAVRSEVAAADERALAIDASLKTRGLALYPFQRVGVKWLASREAGLLSDEMGLGKTIQALAALPATSGVVVVAPAVAKGVWAREAKKWRPDLQVSILKGRGSFRWPTAGEIVVTNYDILPETAEVPSVGTVLISDECHALKSSKAQRTARFRALSAAVRKNSGKVWLLTATPLLNRPPELWSVFQAAGIATEAFGSWPKFVEDFNGRKGKWGGYEWGRPRQSAVEGIQRVSLRRMREDVLPDLPTKTYSDLEVNGIDAKTRKMCDELWSMVGKAEASLAVLSGGAFEQISACRAALATTKIPSMLELVEQFEESEEPIVVFSAHRAPIDTLASREGWAVITGDTPPDERTRIEDRFQRGELKGVGATIKAGGVAITLTRAHCALFVDQEWTPALNEQAEDRICRIGQTRGVQITRLVASHPLDARIAHLLGEKWELIAGSVDASSTTSDQVDVPDFEIAALVAECEAELASPQPIAMRWAKGHEPERQAPEQEAPAVRRPARNATEEWARDGLAQLADDDPDQARDRNDMGFSKFDGAIGHSLAAQAQVGLTEKQWALAIKLCRKYRRQVGESPTEKK